MDTIHVFAEKTSSRQRFIFNHIFSKIMGLEAYFVLDNREFKKIKGFRFNYSGTETKDIPAIIPQGILYEEDIKRNEPDVHYSKDGLPYLKFMDDRNTGFSFDIFSSSFYLLSRYEEYNWEKTDKTGRPDENQSILIRNSLHQKPLIDLWIKAFKKYLVNFYPKLTFNEPGYNFIPTIDIDSAFAYLHRGVARTLGAYFKSAFRANFMEIVHRTNALTGRQGDRFDNFSFLFDIHENYDLYPLFFIQVGKFGKYDKNISPLKPRFKAIIRDISNRYIVGLHPSYKSNNSLDRLVKEKHLLEEITGELASINRQHYLVLKFPETYRRLISIGIREDYSMGFSGVMGFRAGTSHPFHFFDLPEDKETNLIIHPFQVMDATINNTYENPQDAFMEISNIIKMVKKVGGQFISIIHNELYHNDPAGTTWKKWYEDLIHEAKA
ncbi:MAG: polysaccharide deacetylase family protein [Bacteroidota bacterium]